MSGRMMAAILTSAALIGTGAAAFADIPTAEDFAACNAEARAAVSGGSASPTEPTTKDRQQAQQQKRGDTAGRESRDSTGRTITSKNPQIEGMDAAGASDPAYRAAYRSCMRKNGF